MTISLGTTTILLRAGIPPHHRDFAVHETLLQSHSAFFCGALREPWKEAQDHIISMPEDDPLVVNIYVQYLYTGKILGNIHYKAGEYGSVAKRMFQAYVLGEKLQDIDFQDTVADALIATSNVKVGGTFRYATIALRDLVYRGTPSGNRLRRFLVDAVAWHGNVKWLEKFDSVELTTESAEFLLDLSKALLQMKKEPVATVSPIKERDTCKYHQHMLKGVLCYKEKRGREERRAVEVVAEVSFLICCG